MQFSFYVSCKSGRRFTVKIPYLLERKMKVLIKRMKLDSMKLCTGLWVRSWCLCHLVLCARRELRSWYDHICCCCDAWRCAAGHSSSTTPPYNYTDVVGYGEKCSFSCRAEPGPRDMHGMSSASVHMLPGPGCGCERLKH